MANILLLHADPAVASRIQDELAEFSVIGLRSIESVLSVISDPRYELLIAQESLVKPWVECIEGQRPDMLVVLIGDDPLEEQWTRRTLRNVVRAFTGRRSLDL